MFKICCSSKRERIAAMLEKEYPKWEKDDYNADGTKADH